jgi:hypothetical protein
MAELKPPTTFQHGGGGHLEKLRRTPNVVFFGLSTSISVCVLNFIKIGQEMAEIQPSTTFQHGGSGHLGKWRRTPNVVFFEFSTSILFCVLKFIKIGQ